MSEAIIMEAGVKYRVTTDSGEVFTGTFNGHGREVAVTVAPSSM